MRQFPERDAERRRRRPRLRAGGLVVVVLGALLASLGAGVGSATAATSCSGPLDGGQIRVVVVVDPGDLGGGPSSTCLVVGDGTSGAQVLAQRASQLGLPAPRYSGSGLLCSIDGVPGSGCPVNNGGTFDYWAYFRPAGGGWTYGNDNPFARRMHDGDMMGWRYSVGALDGQAPAPRLVPSSSLFPPLAAAPPPAPPPATAPPASGGASGSAPVGGASGRGPTPGVADPAVVDPSASDPATDPSAVDGATGSSAPDTTTVPVDAASDEELAVEPASSSSSAVGRWVGVTIAVVVMGGLGVGAVVRGRTRARP